MHDFIITSNRVVTAEAIAPASIHIRDSKIHAIANRQELPPDVEVVDVGDSVVMPGPGRRTARGPEGTGSDRTGA